MKPLILWARNQYPQPYVLRIGERSGTIVAGTVKVAGAWRPFRFDSQTLEIRIGEGEDGRVVRIDEWGWEQ